MNSDEDCPVTPPKKYKRGSNIFVDDWLTSGEFKGWLEKVPDDVTKAKCKACKTLLNCGKNDLQKHAAGKKHCDNIKLIKASVNIRDALQRPTSNSEQKKISERS
ncbi:unnamed protein product [Macrosiphum euphorbiae]|uniref:Uncharacterized protein n=1 Tax=Macrosiphum euphorbiae TaxID=13131 RepID=A0AAV0WBH6_9HEMI|nr:unnamed protein product [Macrosiphum euphorbiae]